MKVGDLVRIKPESKVASDVRLLGLVIEETSGGIYSQTQFDRRVRVAWQNNIVGTISIMRLERVSESR